MIVQKVEDQALVRALQRELDRGEAEAIALAVQLEADQTLLDEREARRVAKSLGMKVTGVLAILLRARREHRLPSLREAMEELREKAGFHIRADLFAELIRESGEELNKPASMPKE